MGQDLASHYALLLGLNDDWRVRSSFAEGFVTPAAQGAGGHSQLPGQDFERTSAREQQVDGVPAEVRIVVVVWFEHVGSVWLNPACPSNRGNFTQREPFWNARVAAQADEGRFRH
jgi:hypothetical protein